MIFARGALHAALWARTRSRGLFDGRRARSGDFIGGGMTPEQVTRAEELDVALLGAASRASTWPMNTQNRGPGTEPRRMCALSVRRHRHRLLSSSPASSGAEMKSEPTPAASHRSQRPARQDGDPPDGDRRHCPRRLDHNQHHGAGTAMSMACGVGGPVGDHGRLLRRRRPARAQNTPRPRQRQEPQRMTRSSTRPRASRPERLEPEEPVHRLARYRPAEKGVAEAEAGRKLKAQGSPSTSPSPRH